MKEDKPAIPNLVATHAKKAVEPHLSSLIRLIKQTFEYSETSQVHITTKSLVQIENDTSRRQTYRNYKPFYS